MSTETISGERSDRIFWGGRAMSDSFGKPQGRRKRGVRRRTAELRHAHEESEPEDDTDQTPEQRALRAAHDKALRKTELAGDALWFVGVTLALMIFMPPIGVIVMLVWGLKLAKEAYGLELEPRLRKRFVEQEAEKLVHASLSRQRRDLEGVHAKSLEQLSASIAHEIRNPITAAKSLVQQMGERPAAPENVEYAHVALGELQRVERSVSHLLRFAREEDTGMATLDMADVVESALESFRDRAERIGVDIDSQIDCAGTLLGDAEQLRRVIINLVGNAIDALDESVAVYPRVEVRMGENLAGTEVWVRISDNGPGIESDAAGKLFSPFYTSKANGTGLGLSISKKIVDAHGGDIEVTTAPGEGAEFLLTFPKRNPAAGPLS
jgi:signal transduction histidine kinase